MKSQTMNNKRENETELVHLNTNRPVLRNRTDDLDHKRILRTSTHFIQNIFFARHSKINIFLFYNYFFFFHFSISKNDKNQ